MFVWCGNVLLYGVFCVSVVRVCVVLCLRELCLVYGVLFDVRVGLKCVCFVICVCVRCA